MINQGKQFEKDLSSSIPSYCFIHRLKDTAQSYNNSKQTRFTWNNPCDFFIFNSNTHTFFATELKSTKYKSMSVQLDENDKSSKMIKYHQIKSLTEMSRFDGIVAGLFLNFRDEKNNEERTYFINITDFNRMKKEINKISFNELDLILYNAIKIQGEKKRVHYKWNMDEFLKNMNKNMNV